MSNSTHALRALWLQVVDLLAPQDCFLCGVRTEGMALCAACNAGLPRRPDSACPCCGLPGLNGGVCGACARETPAFDATLAVFEFAFPVDVMVHALKYQRRLALAEFFGQALLERGAGFVEGADLLVPMPLHPRRLAERGFNQAVEIARPVVRACGLPLGLAVVNKLRDLPPQAGLDREARLRSPRGAFGGSTSLAGQRVIVVDDVMTTGATLDELARCLKRQGASWVGNLVVARTLTPA